MTRAWAKRIQKLESILQNPGRPLGVFRHGYVRYLPQGTGGERHIVIAKSESTALPNVQRCDFEERAGTAPEARAELSFTVYLSVEDETRQRPPAESSKGETL
jgi:hypothetical protein